MTYINRQTYTLQADEIDHLTIRYTDFGEKLNRKKAVEMIKFYHAVYPQAASALGGTDVSYDGLEAKDEKELYNLLVIIRTVLLNLAFSENEE